MEVILITPTPKYSSLVSATKTIQTSSMDILPIIETQVFLNHHYNLSLFLVNNNFPYQYHYPLKISKYLLDRNEGPVQLIIRYRYIRNFIKYTKLTSRGLKIKIKLKELEEYHILIKMVGDYYQTCYYQLKFAVSKIKSKWEDSNNIDNQISKLLLYIDENNYEEFLTWTDAQADLYTYQQNQELSKQYLSLKQQIDNEKNLFRNKLKMVETIVGQNINVDKLLSEQKQQNQQYKRLRQTFETIKNIDNVLIQQEKRIQSKRKQLKSTIEQKNKVKYQYTKKYVKDKKQVTMVKDEIEKILFKLQYVKKQKAEFENKRNFQVNNKIKQLLNEETKKCKQIVKNMGKFYLGRRLSKNEQILKISYQKQKIVPKNKIIQSLHESNKKQLEQYEKNLKSRVNEFMRQKQNKINSNNEKQKILQDMNKYEQTLKKIVILYQNNHSILCQINKKLIGLSNLVTSATHSTTQTKGDFKFISTHLDYQKSKFTQSRFQHFTHQPQKSNNSAILPFIPSKITWPSQQFIVLNQILTQKSQYINYLNKHKRNKSIDQQNENNKINSNLSINRISQKFIDDDVKSRGKMSRGSLISRSSQLDLQKKYNNSHLGADHILNNKSNIRKLGNKLVKKTVLKAPLSNNQKKMIGTKS